MRARLPRRAVYLLHFARPLAHARHYLGFSTDLPGRLADHEAGRGARLLAVLRELGIGWELARTWKGGRALERRLKDGHRAPQLCPICSGAAAARRGVKP